MDAESRYSRLSRYGPLAAAMPGWRALSAAVVGLGGLGGGLAMHLARLGVQWLALIDRDVVRPENLGHQQLFTQDDADQALPKALAAAQAVVAANPDVEAVGSMEELNRRSIDSLLDGAGALFDGLDNHYGRLLLNDYSRLHNVPYFYAGVVRGELSALAIGGNGPCLRCIMDTPPQAGDVPTCAGEGVFPPLLQVANALQLELATRWLARDAGAFDGTLYTLTLPGWRLRQLKVERRADCPACAGRYEYLDGTLDALASHACSEERVEQVVPWKLDLAAIEQRLIAAGLPASRGRWALTAEARGLRYTLFASGKIVMEGSGDPQQLHQFTAEYLGL
jgi:adenylyltransferase/sulfurtransferase